MLTESEIAQWRADAQAWLTGTCTIQTPTATTDATGGVSVSWANTYTGVAVRVDPDTSAGNETVNNSQLQSRQIYNAHFAHNQTLSPTYRVVFAGDTYEIISVRQNNTWATLNIAQMVLVE